MTFWLLFWFVFNFILSWNQILRNFDCLFAWRPFLSLVGLLKSALGNLLLILLILKLILLQIGRQLMGHWLVIDGFKFFPLLWENWWTMFAIICIIVFLNLLFHKITLIKGKTLSLWLLDLSVNALSRLCC